MTDAVNRVSLPDGRSLDVRVAGPEEGEVLVFHHGTPGAGIPYAPMVEEAASRGLRTVMYSRPGYGSSSRHRGRTVADAASDTAAVLDALGAATFRTVGWSGGGPHALAAAALLADRCLGVATIAGLAPYPAEGIDWYEGMGEDNVQEFSAALAGEEGIMAFLAPYGEAFPSIQAEDVAASLGDLVPEVDHAQLTGGFAEWMASTFREGMREGIYGWGDDDLAFAAPWGFEPSEVSGLTVWQGSADKMVPFAHGRWLADHVPGARRRLLDGEGHLSVAVGRFGAVLDDVLAPPGS